MMCFVFFLQYEKQQEEKRAADLKAKKDKERSKKLQEDIIEFCRRLSIKEEVQAIIVENGWTVASLHDVCIVEQRHWEVLKEQGVAPAAISTMKMELELI
jgi:transposase